MHEKTCFCRRKRKFAGSGFATNDHTAIHPRAIKTIAAGSSGVSIKKKIKKEKKKRKKRKRELSSRLEKEKKEIKLKINKENFF